MVGRSDLDNGVDGIANTDGSGWHGEGSGWDGDGNGWDAVGALMCGAECDMEEWEWE